MPDPIRKRFVLTASYGHYNQRVARIGPGRKCCIRFGSVLPKEGPDHNAQNRPRSDLDGMVRFWPNGSGPEASRGARIIGPGFLHAATGPLPLLYSVRSSTDVPDHIVQNQPGSDLVLAGCVRFWLNGSDPEASRCAGIIRPASGQCGSYLLAVLMYLFINYVVCECNFAF